MAAEEDMLRRAVGLRDGRTCIRVWGYQHYISHYTLRDLTLIESTGKMAACSDIPAYMTSAIILHPIAIPLTTTHHSTGHHVDTPSSSDRQTLIIMILDLTAVTRDRGL